MEESMNIGVIGLGYVGLTFSVAAAHKEITVYGIEINGAIKECLKSNRAHFFEPGLDSLISLCNNRTFFVVDDFPSGVSFDAFIITVGTPLQKGETMPTFDYVRQSLESIARVYTGKELIVLRSTVSVGTTRNIVLPFLSKLRRENGGEPLVAFCPERTVEGKAIEELTQLPQIISGNNEKAIGIAQDLYREITPYVIKADSLEEAELVKLYNNTYRDMSFAIGNVFCMAAESFGVDGIKVIRTANRGYPRSSIPAPGFVAGPCLEKDAYILTSNMEEPSCRNIILNLRKYNESLEDLVARWVEERLEKNKAILISGLAFKGVPETSDLRGSSSARIAQKLAEKGYALYLHDFTAQKNDMEALKIGTVCNDLYEAVEKVSLLLVLNNHDRYKTLDPDMLLARNKNISVLDVWNCCTNLYYNEAVDICTIGNMLIQRGE
jgi:nucleotide sugar dehydrogenase